MKYPVVNGLPRPGLGQMPGEDLAEKLRREGAIINIQIAVPQSYAQQLQAQGQAVPPVQQARGMVDTGASISTVSEQVAAAAGLQTVGSVPLYGVGGGGERPVFASSFSLTDYGVTIDPIEVGGVSINMPGVDILIGRDILKALNLDWRGPAGAFDIVQGSPGSAAAPASPTAAGKGLSTGTWLAIGGGAAAAVVGALFAFDAL